VNKRTISFLIRHFGKSRNLRPEREAELERMAVDYFNKYNNAQARIKDLEAKNVN